jgi:hypothetical protein
MACFSQCAKSPMSLASDNAMLATAVIAFAPHNPSSPVSRGSAPLRRPPRI